MDEGRTIYVVMGLDEKLNPDFFGAFDDEDEAWRCAATYDALVHMVDYWPDELLIEVDWGGVINKAKGLDK